MKSITLCIAMIISAIMLLICYIVSCITTNKIIYKVSTGLVIVSLMFMISFILAYIEY